MVPLPKQLTTNKPFTEFIKSFLRSYRRHWPHNNAVCDTASIIRSRNTTMEEMEKFANSLDLKPAAGDPSTTGFFKLQHWFPRIWDEWGRSKDGAEPDDFIAETASLEVSPDEDWSVSLRPQTPSFLDKDVYTGALRCANEISFGFFHAPEPMAAVFPHRPGKNLISAISEFPLDNWRIGRNGLVNLIRFGHRTNWKLPTAEAVMFGWLEDQGWKPKPSPAGILAKQIYRRLDGLLNLLRNKQLLGLFEHMSGGPVEADGTPKADPSKKHERELTADKIRKVLKNSSARGDLVRAIG